MIDNLGGSGATRSTYSGNWQKRIAFLDSHVPDFGRELDTVMAAIDGGKVPPNRCVLQVQDGKLLVTYSGIGAGASGARSGPS